MKRDLCLSSLQLKGSIPRSTFWAIEPTAQRMRMSESSVHDVGVGDTKKQFVDADAWKPVRLSQESVIGGAVEFEKLLQLLVIVRQARKNTFIAVS